jgi:hypothetical protein
LAMINRWVSVTGVLTNYKRRPQIALDTGYGIEILVNEDEAKFRLGIISTEKNEERLLTDRLTTQKLKVEETVKPIRDIFPEIVLPSQPVYLERMRNYERNIQKKIDELYRAIPLDKSGKQTKNQNNPGNNFSETDNESLKNI